MVKRLRWTPALVNAFWSGVAQSELDDLSFGKVAGPRFLDLVGDYLARDGRHLDFGAGSGHFVRLLLDRGLRAGGFDPSNDRQGHLVTAIGERDGFLGVVGPESEDQFDVVFLMEVVEHVLDEDFDAVLRRVAAFVKPGGTVIVSTPNNEDLAHAAVFCPACESLFHPWQHVRTFTPGRLVETFAAVGFSRAFLALADFSCDADLYEASKKAVAMKQATEQAIEHLQRAIEATIEARARQREVFDGYGAIGGGLSAKGLARMLRAPLQTLRYWRLLPEEAERLEQLLVHASRELARVRAPHRPTSREDALADLRTGRESTIVYVGRKS